MMTNGCGGMMTTIIRLEPPMPFVCPKGPCWAHFLIDMGMENSLHWVTFVNETGECWTWSNEQVRMDKNITLKRTEVSIK